MQDTATKTATETHTKKQNISLKYFIDYLPNILSSPISLSVAPVNFKIKKKKTNITVQKKSQLSNNQPSLSFSFFFPPSTPCFWSRGFNTTATSSETLSNRLSGRKSGFSCKRDTSETVPNQSASDTFRSTCIGWGYFDRRHRCYRIQLSQFSCISFLHLPSLLVLLLHLLPQVWKVHSSVECLSCFERGHLY